MRLSRALCVVLLLHVIALVGVYVFTYVKDGKPPARTAVRSDPSAAQREPRASLPPKAHDSPVVSVLPAHQKVADAKATTAGTSKNPPAAPKAKPAVALSQSKPKTGGVATVSPAKVRTAQEEAAELIGAQSN